MNQCCLLVTLNCLLRWFNDCYPLAVLNCLQRCLTDCCSLVMLSYSQHYLKNYCLIIIMASYLRGSVGCWVEGVERFVISLKSKANYFVIIISFLLFISNHYPFACIFNIHLITWSFLFSFYYCSSLIIFNNHVFLDFIF